MATSLELDTKKASRRRPFPFSWFLRVQRESTRIMNSF